MVKKAEDPTFFVDAHGAVKPSFGRVPKRTKIVFLAPLGRSVTGSIALTLLAAEDVDRVKSGAVLTFAGDDGKPHDMYVSRYFEGDRFPDVSLSPTTLQDPKGRASLSRLPFRNFNAAVKKAGGKEIKANTTLEELVKDNGAGTYVVGSCRPCAAAFKPAFALIERMARTPRTPQVHPSSRQEQGFLDWFLGRPPPPPASKATSESGSFTRQTRRAPSDRSYSTMEGDRRMVQAYMKASKRDFWRDEGAPGPNSSIHHRRTPQDRAGRGQKSAAERRREVRMQDRLQDLMDRFGQKRGSSSSEASASDRQETKRRRVNKGAKGSGSSTGSANQRRCARRA